MQYRQARQRGMRWGPLLLTAFALLAMTGGTVAGLWAVGVFGAEPQEPSHEGEVAYPAAVKSIPAYTRITQEHLLDPQTGRLRLVWLKEGQANAAILRDMRQILGRVTAHDKTGGLVFTDSDFLPKGTRPGVTAGIPPGKRSLTVPVDKIQGLGMLRQGDLFDLVVSLPGDGKSAIDSNVEYAALLGGVKPPESRAGALRRRSGVRVLVRDGMMVALTQGPLQSTEGSQSLVVDPPGSRRPTAPTINATVAIAPNEVDPLAEALGLSVPIYSVARSGHADDPGDPTSELSLEGMIPVPATVRPVKAYSRIAQEDLADPVSGRLNVFYFAADRIDDGWIRDFSTLVGRVAARDLQAGHLFTDQDLLPPGTQPGLVAAVPPGKVAMTVPKSRVEGLDGLNVMDRFDVLSTLPNDVRPSSPAFDWATVMGGRPSPQAAELQQQLRNGMRIIVRDATKLTNGSDGDQIAIAIAADEVERLTGVLLLDVTLKAVAHPGRRAAQPLGNVASANAPNSGDGGHVGPVQFVGLQDGEDARVSGGAGREPVAADGGIPVPVTTGAIKAYERIRPEHFVDAATGSPRILYFSESAIGEDWNRDLRTLVDRVAARDLEPGYVIRERDLLPVGTRPGPAAGVPAGKVAFSVNDRQVAGLTGFRPRDRVDLLAARPLDETIATTPIRFGLANGSAAGQWDLLGNFVGRARVEVLASEAVLVTFEEPREVVLREVRESAPEPRGEHQVTPSGLVRTEETRSRPRIETYTTTVQDFVLAVDPAEVAALSEAVSTGTTIYAAPRSGNPQDASRPRSISERRPPGEAHVVEHIRGRSHQREIWIGSEPSPVERPTRSAPRPEAGEEN